MSITIDLEPAEQIRLEAIARRHGMKPTELARRLLALDLQPTGQTTLTELEWTALEADIAEEIDPNVPPLSDEALSRESYYGRRA